MTKFIYFILALSSLQIAFGQATTMQIEMQKEQWIVPADAVFEQFDNRATLLLKKGTRATVKNLQFSNGTIEVDVYANKRRSFAGITFRKQNDNMEEVYMRMHKSSQADAVQYTPIFNGESNWQLYREYQAQLSFKNEGWNRLRIELNDSNAVVFVNDQKAMSIAGLRTDQPIGQIGLFALFSNRFSNFRVTPKEEVTSENQAIKVIRDKGIISHWKITKAAPYKGQQLDVQDFEKRSYTTVETEASGLLAISKYIRKSSFGSFEQNAEDYIIATTTVDAEQDEIKLFSFDYSDKILVYLNGQLYFEGNNAFRTKGVQYMGHLAIDTNKLYLPLKKGTNEIHCVVIDKANGWGVMAKLE